MLSISYSDDPSAENIQYVEVYVNGKNTLSLHDYHIVFDSLLTSIKDSYNIYYYITYIDDEDKIINAENSFDLAKRLGIISDIMNIVRSFFK